jgi:hypothetical protein
MASVQALMEVGQVTAPVRLEVEVRHRLKAVSASGDIDYLVNPVGTERAAAAGYDVPDAGLDHQAVGLDSAHDLGWLLPPPVADLENLPAPDRGRHDWQVRHVL